MSPDRAGPPGHPSRRGGQLIARTAPGIGGSAASLTHKARGPRTAIRGSRDSSGDSGVAEQRIHEIGKDSNQLHIPERMQQAQTDCWLQTLKLWNVVRTIEAAITATSRALYFRKRPGKVGSCGCPSKSHFIKWHFRTPQVVDTPAATRFQATSLQNPLHSVPDSIWLLK